MRRVGVFGIAAWLCVVLSASAAEGPAAAPWPTFVDVTERAGIPFKHSIGDHDLDNIVEGTGSGACVFDYDNDGFVDVYFPQGRWTKGVSDNRGRDLIGKLSNALYRNNGDGTFVDVTEKAGVGGKSFGFSCSTADFDGDGDEDLYVLNYGPNQFFRNDGDGTFTDVTETTGLGNPLWSLSAPWLDYDGDGKLDVYVGNYLEYDEGKFRSFYAAAGYPGPLSYNGQQDALYRNNGDGTFSDVTKEAGVVAPNGRCMSAAAADLNNDGLPDIYVANDSMESYYFENGGKGKFVEKGVMAGLAFGQNGQGVSHMGPSLADVDRDGRLDMMIPDMDYSSLLMNRGEFFEDAIGASGLAAMLGQYISWCGVFGDFDNDGYADLFVSNGNAHHEYPEHQVITRSDGRGRFLDMADRSGDYFKVKWMGRGAVSLDYDNDGDVDILVVHLNSAPHLLRNDGGSVAGHWLKVDLRLANGKTPAVGARVAVVAGGLRQIEEYVGVRGYLSQSDIRAHFGLGNAEKADLIEVRWPNGSVQQIKDVRADRILTVVQGSR
jgi:hypothetical protein